MKKELKKYFKNVKEINLKKLEKIVQVKVIDPVTNKKRTHKVRIRINPAFGSKARISPERELRPVEIIQKISSKETSTCFFCDPENKCAKFAPEFGLKKLYYLNNSVVFPNSFPSGKIHGMVVYNFKFHDTDPRKLKVNNWVDGIKLVQKIGKLTRKKFVSTHINCGPKAGASLEHFHGQFHCEDSPLAKTELSVKLTDKKWWKSWVKTMFEEGLVIGFDRESKVVLYAEWSPVFGKAELVIVTLEKPSFQSMNGKEIRSVANFLDKAIKIIMKVSDQFNVVNLSTSAKGNFCNQFRIFSRAPLAQGLKSWEGYLEFMGETVSHIDPKKLVRL